jgi:hypothetical protein
MDPVQLRIEAEVTQALVAVNKLREDYFKFNVAAQKYNAEYARSVQEVSRVVNQLSGDAVIRTATQYVQAIQQIGGAHRLTEHEQVKVNKLLTEAAEKYRALGREVPAELQKIVAATAAAGKKIHDHIGSGFSGQKIAADATRVVQAIERIGGVSKLTERELKQVSKVLEEASAKSKQMGEVVPANIKKVLDQVRQLTNAKGQTNIFGGDKLLREANSYVEAIKRVGGVHRLTVTEQLKVHKVLDEASKKYAALGRQVPADMEKILRATRTVSEGTQSAGFSWAKFGLAVSGGVLAGQTAVTFASGIIKKALNNIEDAVRATAESFVYLVQRGSEVARIQGAFQNLAGSIIETRADGVRVQQMFEETLEAGRKGMQGLVTDFDLMQAANRGVLLGLPLTSKNFETLTRGALALGRAMGLSATKSLDDLVLALGRSSPRILDNLGIIVKIGEANKKWADAHNMTVKQMSAGQRTIAFYNEALAKMEAKLTTMGPVTLTLGEKFEALSVFVQNYRDRLALAISLSPVLNKAMDVIGQAIMRNLGGNQEDSIRRIVMIVNETAIAAVKMAENVLFAFGMMAKGIAASMDTVEGQHSKTLLMLRDTLEITRLTAKALANVPGADIVGIGKIQEATGIAVTAINTLMNASASARSAIAETANAAGTAALAGSKVLRDLLPQLDEVKNKYVSNLEIQKAIIRTTNEEGEAQEELTEKQKKEIEKRVKAFEKSYQKLREYTFKIAREQQEEFVKRIEEEAEGIDKVIWKNLELTIKAQDEANRLIMERTNTKTNYQISEVQRWAREEKAQIDQSVPNWRAAYEAIEQTASEKITKILSESEDLRNVLINLGTLTGGLFGAMEMGPIDAPDKEKVEQISAWEKGLQKAANAWSQLSQIVGASESKFTKAMAAVGQLIGLMNIGAQAGHRFGDALDKIGKELDKKEKDWSAIGGAIGDLVLQIPQMIAVMDAATQGASKMGRAVSGAMTGASIGGAIIPGWGHLGGALIGALIGAFRKVRFREEIQNVVKKWGVTINEELAKSIEKDAKERFKGDWVASQLFHFADIIEQAGGIKKSNINQLTQGLHDIFSAVETGKMSVDDARESFDRAFPMFTKHIEESGGVASEAIHELIDLNKQFGLESKAILDFINKNLDDFNSAMKNLLGPAKKGFDELISKTEELHKKERDLLNEPGGEAGMSRRQKKELAELREEIEKNDQKLLGLTQTTKDYGLVVTATFRGAIAEGLSRQEVFDKLGPSIQELIPLYDALKAKGVQFNDSLFESLIAEQKLVDKFPELVAAAGSFDDLFRSMQNLRGLTEETFQGAERQMLDLVQRMRDAGFSNEAILGRIAPALDEIVKLQKDGKIVISESTAELIAQAGAADLLGKSSQTAADTMKQGFDNVAIGLAAVIEALGKKVPEALQEIVDKANEARRATEGIGDAAADSVDEFGRAGKAGREAMEKLMGAAREAKKAVDRVSYGESPGGINSIPVELGKVIIAAADFERKTVGSFHRLKTAVDQVGDINIRTNQEPIQAFRPTVRTIPEVREEQPFSVSRLVPKPEAPTPNLGLRSVEDSKEVIRTLSDEVERIASTIGESLNKIADLTIGAQNAKTEEDRQVIQRAIDVQQQYVQEQERLGAETQQRLEAELQALEKMRKFYEASGKPLADAVGARPPKERPEEQPEPRPQDTIDRDDLRRWLEGEREPVLGPPRTIGGGGPPRDVMPRIRSEEEIRQLQEELERLDSLDLNSKESLDLQRQLVLAIQEAEARAAREQEITRNVFSRQQPVGPDVFRLLDSKLQSILPRIPRDDDKLPDIRFIPPPTSKQELMERPFMPPVVNQQPQVINRSDFHINVPSGAVQQNISTWTLGTERDIIKDRIAPKLLGNIGEGGDLHSQLAGIVTQIIADKGGMTR